MTDQTVYLDSSAIVKRYLNEEGTDIVDSLFKEAENKSTVLCFSIWNIGEVIGVLDKNDRRRKIKFPKSVDNFVNELGRLDKSGSIKTVEITLPLIFDASRILLKYKLYMADALQIVSCKEANCSDFYTADKRVHEAAVSEGLNSIYMLKSS